RRGADDRLEKRRLARTVAPQEGHDLVGAHIEGDVAKDVALAVEGVYPLQDEQRLWACGRWSSLPRQRMRPRSDIDLLHLGGRARILDGAVDEHQAVVHDRNCIGELKHTVDVVLDEQYWNLC